MEDLSDFFKGSIALVPIRIGSGLRMKILDAVSLGIPFVTTSKGVEGISFNDNEECLKADTAMDFADAIIRLANDSNMQCRLVLQAKRKLEDLYDWKKMLEQRMAIYSHILNF